MLIAIVLMLDAMAACPALHEMIHKDAGHEDHECAVTMFAHGQVDSVTVDVVPVVFIATVEITQQIDFTVFSPSIAHLPSGRAPPVLPSVS